MDPRYQKNRQPARPTAPGRVNPVQTTEVPTNNQPTANYRQVPKESSNRMSKKSLAALILVALVALGGYVGWQYVDNGGVARDKYQAVFLNNDQVYFGKIKKVNDDTLVLTDIYYLQQTQKEGANQNQTSGQAGNQTSLAKLGDELHGPQDQMNINMDQVLFWENLKDDGKVVTAIKEYKK